MDCALKKRLILLAVSLFLFFPPLTSTAVIRSIQIAGNSAFSTREIIEGLSSRPGRTVSDSTIGNDTRKVVEMYRRGGYLAARVEALQINPASDSALVDIVLRVEEGRQTILGRVAIEGTSLHRTEELLSQFDSRPGDPLAESTLEQDLGTVIQWYERQGYPFVEASIGRMITRPGETRDTVDVILHVEEGERLMIDEIRVEGNKETDPSVIVRETRLTPGEPYRPSKVEAIRQRLNRLSIFSSVEEPQLYRRGAKGGLLIKVQEGTTNTFDGVLGYVPGPSSGESGYLTGLATISMRNLLGTGRKLSFRWQREDRHSQELGVRYLEPWVLGLPFNIGLGFSQRQQDTSFVRRVFDLNGDLMISEELSLGIVLGMESVIPSADSTVNRVFKSSATTVGVAFQYDTRDDLYSPTSGARYHTDYQYGRKTTSEVPQAFVSRVPANTSVQKLGVDLDAYISLWSRQIVAAGFHGRELRSGQVEEGEMYRLGGLRTLRGYRESQFVGSRIAWTNLEYRFLLSRRSFLFGFVDTGYYSRPGDEVRLIPSADAFRYGYGVGVQLETALGVVSVSFALGQGDTFTDGKIHFGLVNEF